MNRLEATWARLRRRRRGADSALAGVAQELWLAGQALERAAVAMKHAQVTPNLITATKLAATRAQMVVAQLTGVSTPRQAPPAARGTP